MAQSAKRTEHAGAKHAKGYWGTKADAKHESKRQRRINDKKAAREEE